MKYGAKQRRLRHEKWDEQDNNDTVLYALRLQIDRYLPMSRTRCREWDQRNSSPEPLRAISHIRTEALFRAWINRTSYGLSVASTCSVRD